MPQSRIVLLLALTPVAAFAQAPPTAPPTFSCRLCTAPTASRSPNSASRTAINDAIRALGSKSLPGIASKQSDPPAVASPSSMRWNAEVLPAPRGIVAMRSGPCSVPLVRVPVDPNVDPKMVLRPAAPTEPMPQFRGPAPPCDQPAVAAP